LNYEFGLSRENKQRFLRQDLTDDEVEELSEAQKFVRNKLHIQMDHDQMERASYELELEDPEILKQRYSEWEHSLSEYLNEDPGEDMQREIAQNAITETLNGSGGILDQAATELLIEVGSRLAVEMDIAESMFSQCKPEDMVHLMIVAKFVGWLSVENTRMYWGHQNQFIDAFSAFNLAVPWYGKLTGGTVLYTELETTYNTVMAQFVDESSQTINYSQLFSRVAYDAECVIFFVESFDAVLDSMHLPELNTRASDYEYSD